MTDQGISPENETPELAAGLGAMSRWEGDEGNVWEAALEQARPRGGWLFRKLPRGYMAAAAVLVIGTLIAVMVLPSLGKARSSARSPGSSGSAMDAFEAKRMTPALASSSDREIEPASPPPMDSGTVLYSLEAPKTALRANAEVAKDGRYSSSAASSTLDQPAGLAERQVIRKANIDLKARDVRAVFLKAAQVLREAQGEYIEQSSLTGQDEDLQGSLTLRVAAGRLSGVLNQLRGLAEVTSESSGGEDVTNQVVDLEARLKNEQRVEAELLGLMESRKDAPLKEILELRDSINRVRENIERMTAQRERLGRLVSLATVLVIINPDTTKPAPLPDGIGTYFIKEVRGAWQTSMELLTDSVSFIIKLFVGGAFFWLMAALVAMGVMGLRRRSLRRAAMEPAPRMA